jgi:hypothetical protein
MLACDCPIVALPNGSTYHDHRPDCPNRVSAWATRRAQRAVLRRRARWEAQQAIANPSPAREGEGLR